MKKLLISTMIGLVLMSVLVSATFAAPAARRELLLKGSIQSLETYIVNFPTMSVTANGSGYATQLGKFAVSYTVQVNLLTNEVVRPLGTPQQTYTNLRRRSANVRVKKLGPQARHNTSLSNKCCQSISCGLEPET